MMNALRRTAILKPHRRFGQVSPPFIREFNTDSLYPGSRQTDRFRKPEQTTTATTTFDGHIPMNELSFSCSSPSGPGGQNANRSNSKVEARFHLENSSFLSAEAKSVLADKWRHQLTKDGWFVARSDRTRSQQLNRADVLAKIRHAIWKELEDHVTRLEAAQLDDLEREKLRKQKVRAANERLKEKRSRSQVKRDRSAKDEWPF